MAPIHSQLQELVSLSPDPIIGVDREGIVNLFNLAAERLLGYSGEDILNKLAITQVYPSTEQARQINKLLHASPDRQIEGCETQLISKAGRIIDIRLSAKLIMRDGQQSGSIGFFHDMTEGKRLESVLKQMTITDNLTGLYNQRHFRSVLDVELERAIRYDRPLCLICIDLDNFKEVNDRLGHLEGDNALRFTARILQKKLRKTDTAFRYGGDEFMMLLPETHYSDAEAIGARMQEVFIEQWATEWLTNPDSPLVSMSLGVAELDPADTSESFIRKADAFMYAAKKNRTLNRSR